MGESLKDFIARVRKHLELEVAVGDVLDGLDTIERFRRVMGKRKKIELKNGYQRGFPTFRLDGIVVGPGVCRLLRRREDIDALPENHWGVHWWDGPDVVMLCKSLFGKSAESRVARDHLLVMILTCHAAKAGRDEGGYMRQLAAHAFHTALREAYEED